MNPNSMCVWEFLFGLEESSCGTQKRFPSFARRHSRPLQGHLSLQSLRQFSPEYVVIWELLEYATEVVYAQDRGMPLGLLFRLGDADPLFPAAINRFHHAAGLSKLSR